MKRSPHVPLILLVEDNRDDIDLTLRALKRHRLLNQVVVARDGVEALDFVFATGAHAGRDPQVLPQLILLDVNLPKLNGFEVLEKIREHPHTRNLPIVMLTSSEEDRDIDESYRRGANSYIQKPVSFEDFTRAVDHLGIYWLALNKAPV